MLMAAPPRRVSQQARQPGRLQQLGGLEQRQSHHARIAAVEAFDENRGHAPGWHSRPPCRAAPRFPSRPAHSAWLSWRNVTSLLLSAGGRRRVGADQRDRGEHGVRAAGQARQHRKSIGRTRRLAADPPVEHHDGVGPQHRQCPGVAAHRLGLGCAPCARHSRRRLPRPAPTRRCWRQPWCAPRRSAPAARAAAATRRPGTTWVRVARASVAMIGMVRSVRSAPDRAARRAARAPGRAGRVSVDSDQRAWLRASTSGASPSGPPIRSARSSPACLRAPSHADSSRVVNWVPRSSSATT